MSAHPTSAPLTEDAETPSDLGETAVRRARSMDRILKAGWIIAATLGAAGCSAVSDDDGTIDQASRTRWQLPEDIRSVASSVTIPYEGAPGWNPNRCGGRLLAGTSALGQHVMSKFGQVRSIGGYACRPNTANTSQMSVHGTGRALDIFIPMRGGRANDSGDSVANWLVKNAADIGVQLVIWNRTVWQANGRSEKAYSGPHPHNDHIHVEITTRASKKLTPFFNRLEAEGVIDDDAGITTASVDEDAGDIPVPTMDASAKDASAKADATVKPADAAAPPAVDAAAPAAEPEPEGEDHDHDTEIREYREDLDDNAPGEQDSIGAGIRERPASSDADLPDGPQAGCSAAPIGSSRTASGAGLALALAAVLIRRRRKG